MKRILLTIIFLISANIYAQHTVTIKKGDSKNFTYYTLQGDTTKYSFKATIADYEGRFKDAAKYTVMGIERGEYKKVHNAYYDASCYFTLVKEYDKAIEYLAKSVNNGWEDIGRLEHDPDLQALKKAKGWRKDITPFLKKYYKSNSKEIARMFANDQNPRLAGTVGPDMPKKDSIRRVVVRKMVKEGQLKSGHDYYKAAFIMHHGETVSDYELANILAQKAMKANQVHHMAPWLSAAVKDRLLLKQGKPQWYGTQGMTFLNGKMAMDPKKIDTTKVTPAQRKALNAPKIETLRMYLKNFKSN